MEAQICFAGCRLAKLDAEQGHPAKFDAILLAAVGLQRMGYESRISQHMDACDFPYAVGQGSLGIECRVEDSKTIGLVRFLHSPKAAIECRAERAFLRALAGGCRVPVGVVAHAEPISGADGGRFSLDFDGRVWSVDGTYQFAAKDKAVVTSESEAEALGIRCAERVRQDAAAAGHEEVVTAVASIAAK